MASNASPEIITIKNKQLSGNDEIEGTGKRRRIQVGCSDTSYTKKYRWEQTFEHYIHESDVEYIK
jgi:hypothetical protein